MLRLAKVPVSLEVVSIGWQQQWLQYYLAHQMPPLAKVPLINKSWFHQLVTAVLAVLPGASDAPLGKSATSHWKLFPPSGTAVLAVRVGASDASGRKRDTDRQKMFSWISSSSGCSTSRRI